MKLNFSNKNWVLLSTTIAIGLAFSIYFLVYVKAKEKAIISNNFRVLQQIVSNIKTLEQSYSKNADIMSKDPKSKELNKNIQPLSAEQCTKVEEEEDSIIHNVNYIIEGLLFKVKNIYGSSSKCNYYFSPYTVFFNNDLFQRKDIFDQIIIEKVTKDKNGNVERREVLYSNGSLGIMDSTFSKKSLRSAKDEININDIQYVSFNQQIDIKQNIFISALVLKSDFEQQKRSVSPFVIFTLSIALILIILAMPLLKLKIMNKEERLYIKDVIFSVISVLIGPAVFMVFLYISFSFFGRDKRNLKDNLDALSAKVEQNFRTELGRLVIQLEDLDNDFPSISNLSILNKNRFIIANNSSLSKFFTESDLTIRNHTTEKILEEDYLREHDYGLDWIYGYRMYQDVVQSNSVTFKHLKAAFWSTEKAKALVMLSAFHFPSYAQDLHHRKYLTNIIENKPTIFQDSSGATHKIAIESIKSVNDGSYEVGVGISTGGVVLPVLALSAKLSSVMGTILEEGYGFCIIDKEGNTMFHSDIKKNMNENFVNETQGIFLHAIMSHSSMVASINYNGKKQTIFFRPLDCLSDHYIATFIDDELQNGPLTIFMISCFILFLGYLVFVLIVYVIMYYTTFKSTKLKQAVYMFNFLRPYETENHFTKYKRLISVSTVVIAYLILSSLINARHYDFLIFDLVLTSVSLLIFSFLLSV